METNVFIYLFILRLGYVPFVYMERAGFILQPANKWWSKCFGFTFQDVWATLGTDKEKSWADITSVLNLLGERKKQPEPSADGVAKQW